MPGACDVVDWATRLGGTRQGRAVRCLTAAGMTVMAFAKRSQVWPGGWLRPIRVLVANSLNDLCGLCGNSCLSLSSCTAAGGPGSPTVIMNKHMLLTLLVVLLLAEYGHDGPEGPPAPGPGCKVELLR
jgi:hypothetical protein